MSGAIKNVRFRSRLYITITVLTLASTPMTVYADLNGTWNVMMEAVFPFLFKLGMLLVVFGAVEFAASIQNEDALQKVRAMRFMTAGAVMAAVITMVKPYLMI